MNILPVNNITFTSRHKQKEVQVLLLDKSQAIDYILDKYLPVIERIKDCKKAMAKLSPNIYLSKDGDMYKRKIEALNTLKREYSALKKAKRGMELNIKKIKNADDKATVCLNFANRK